jgi:hypothetical protein
MAVKLSFGKPLNADPFGCVEEGCPQHEHPHVHVSPEGFTKVPVVADSKKPSKPLPATYVDKHGESYEITAQNWHHYCKSWALEDAWWVHFTTLVANEVIKSVLLDYQKCDEPSFALFCQNVLPELISEQHGPYLVPVNLLEVSQHGPDSQVILKVGPVTVEFIEWQVGLLKKTKEKSENKAVGVEHVLDAKKPELVVGGDPDGPKFA